MTDSLDGLARAAAVALRVQPAPTANVNEILEALEACVRFAGSSEEVRLGGQVHKFVVAVQRGDGPGAERLLRQIKDTAEYVQNWD